MTHQKPATVLDGSTSPDEPRPLPYAAYPKAADVDRHSLQHLPESLPLVDFARAQPHRSSRHSTINATDLTPEQKLQAAWVIATGFAQREPQARHLRPPKDPPAELMEARHTDPFGTTSFGSWDTATQMYWIVRLAALTDPTSPRDAIEVNEDVLDQSLAVVDGEERVIGAAFNETMPPFDVEPPLSSGRSLPRHRVHGMGAGLHGAWCPGRGGACGTLREVPGFPEGLRRRQSHPPSSDCPLGRSSERGCLRTRGGQRGKVPGARPRVYGHRGDQPVDGGGLRSPGRSARSFRPVPG